MNHVEVQAGDGRLGLQVRQIRFEGIGINSYELVDPAGKTLPAFEAGAHVDIHLGEGLVRQYSLCNDPPNDTAIISMAAIRPTVSTSRSCCASPNRARISTTAARRAS